MSWYRDLDTTTMVAVGDHVRAIGWLSSSYLFTQGEVPAEVLARLRAFARLSMESAEALSFPAFGGIHTCDFCGEFPDAGNFGVPAGHVLYVAPGMVTHYVAHHGYAPPEEFITALMASPLPGSAQYKASTADFGRRHREWFRELMERHKLSS